ncbi:MAG: HlyD family efflux transporter periplasmic adaptor subunit [Chlorobi bacterium]|nr:HlyD family efflux transporter periplasmic adaptor subunit [Chlorobiota bacterium]
MKQKIKSGFSGSRIWFILILFFITSGSWQCSNTGSDQNAVHIEEDNHTSGEQAEEQVVIMSDKVMKEFNIETARAAAGNLDIYIQLPGEIVIPPANLAHVHPRFPGVVKEVKKQTGDAVKAGEVLAVIESNQSLSDYVLKSQIDGIITEMHITRGEMVDDNIHGFVIADLSTVWAYLQIYRKDLPSIHPGQPVMIIAETGSPKVKGTIDYISPIINEETRTATARVVLRNSGYQWKPGMFITGKVTVSGSYVKILIPKTAIEMLDDKPVVFIRKGERFYPSKIVTGKENNEFVEVLDGLKEGQVYAARHAFTLKAELQKREFGEGHGH